MRKRENNAESVANLTSIHEELTKVQKEFEKNQKKSYKEYLELQGNQSKIKKLKEIEDRRYDPNTEKIIRENALIGERIVKCHTTK